MNPRFQDGSFQTPADMLRNQQREFVEPLVQQMAAFLGATLASSIALTMGRAVQAAQNRDVRPTREQDYGTNQHKILQSMYPKDKLFTQQAIVEKHTELSRKRQMLRDHACTLRGTSLEYDVEWAWKRMRATHGEECWRFIQNHQGMYRAHLEKACAPSYVEKEAVDQVTSLLARHAQLFCGGGVVLSSQGLDTADRQAEFRPESRAAPSPFRRRQSVASKPWNQLRRSTKPRTRGASS